jgi:integrase
MSGTRAPRGTGSVRVVDGRHEASYSFTDEMGRRRRRSQRFDTRTAARAWLRDRTAETAAGRVTDREVTVGEFLVDWLGSLGMAQLEAATISWYRSAVHKHIIPVIGGVKLAKLTPVTVEAFLDGKAKSGRLDGKGGLGPASVRRLAITLGKALTAAVRAGLLPANPVALAAKPKVPAQDVTADVWTPEHVAMFLEATRTDRLAPMWRTATMTGLRLQELAGLGWRDVDLEAGVVSVRRARTQVDGEIIVKGPKTPSSRRTVDLDEGTVRVLGRWKVAQLEERMAAGPAWESGDWVFTDELGRPWRPDGIRYRLQKAVAAAGLPPTDVKGLRHAHATALLKAGVHHKVVQERLGHSSSRVTLDVYSAVLPGIQREAVDRLAEMIGSIGGE